MDEHTPKEKTKARKSGSSLLSKVTQLGLGANIFAAAVYWEPTHRCHRVAVYLPPDHEFPDVDGLIRDALPDRPPSPGAWRRHRLPTRYDYDDKEKAKARKSGPSLLNKTIELGESARIFAATIYWEPTHRLYEVAAYLPDGEFVPSVHNLVMEASSGPRTRSSLRHTLRRITAGRHRKALRRTRAQSPSIATTGPTSLSGNPSNTLSPNTATLPPFSSPMATTSPITCKTDSEPSPGERPVMQEEPTDSIVEVDTTTLDMMEEEETKHIGFSEQLDSEPCDLRSPEELIYPNGSEARQEVVVTALLMNPDTALPTTEKTTPAETFPSETLRAETSLSQTPPMETPMVDYAQNQTHPFISINRIDVQVMTRRGSTPCNEGWKKHVLDLLERTHAVIASVLQ